jgi:hypothetical protein
MATGTGEANLTNQITVLVGEPHGDHIHEQWWPLSRLATQLASSPTAKKPAKQVRVLVRVPHGAHAINRFASSIS